MGPGEVCRTCCKCIEVWGFDNRVAVEANMIKAMLVSHQEQDVWRAHEVTAIRSFDDSSVQ